MAILEAAGTICTDTATIAIFDFAVFAGQVKDGADWWCYKPEKEAEFRDGEAALVGIGGDGCYAVRVTTGSLTEDELTYAKEVTNVLGVRVKSGSLFVGKGEAIPCDGTETLDQAVTYGLGFPLAIGSGPYDLRVFGIHWHEAPQWWTGTSRAHPNAPADLVIQLESRVRKFQPISQEPRLAGWSETWLFPERPRRLGPEAGMKIVTRVWKDARGGSLSLKACGPGSYRAELNDYSMVAWKDEVEVVVDTVDHLNRYFTGRFERKLPPGTLKIG